MINVIVILMECITMWLCLHIAFGEKIKKNRWEVLFFVVYISVCVLCAYNLVSKVLYLGLWIFVFVWCFVLFRQKILSSLIRTAIGIVSVGVVETVVIFCYSLVIIETNMSVNAECLIACMLTLLLTILLYYEIFCRISFSMKNFTDKNILVLSFYIILFLLYVKLEFELNRKVSVIYVFFFVFLSVIFIYLCRKQKLIYELEKKNLNLELQNMYGNAYDDLLKEVRRRQHDYKNQLTAVCSMYSTANSLEELKSMQETYLGILKDEREFDSILTRCNNPILAGYIYNMCLKYKGEGIKITVDVSVKNKEIDIKTKDIIEILGILLNNASEYYSLNKFPELYIGLKLQDKEDKKYIEVENISDYLSYEVLEAMFEKGYSTKGSNRGIGLYSVKNIITKYNGEIYVENVKREDRNLLVFRVII